MTLPMSRRTKYLQFYYLLFDYSLDCWIAVLVVVAAMAFSVADCVIISICALKKPPMDSFNLFKNAAAAAATTAAITLWHMNMILSRSRWADESLSFRSFSHSTVYTKFPLFAIKLIILCFVEMNWCVCGRNRFDHASMRPNRNTIPSAKNHSKLFRGKNIVSNRIRASGSPNSSYFTGILLSSLRITITIILISSRFNFALVSNSIFHFASVDSPLRRFAENAHRSQSQTHKNGIFSLH